MKLDGSSAKRPGTNFVDLSGAEFGKLTALEHTGERRSNSVVWRCRCACGKVVLVAASALRGGTTRSCGCLRRETDYPGRTPENRVGKRYAGLTVIALAERGDPTRTSPKGTLRWLCRCDCGSVKAIPARELGHTKSCGCAAYARCEAGRAGLTVLICRYQHKARERGLAFNLSRDEFARITSAPCHYCGAAPKLKASGTSNERAENAEAYAAHTAYVFNGVDRVDSSRGYEAGNVVTCCADCNRAKSDLGVVEFLAWLERAYLHSAAASRVRSAG